MKNLHNMDKTIVCSRCGNDFIWSGEEQTLYTERGLPAPSYCPICRGIIEARKNDSARNTYERQS